MRRGRTLPQSMRRGKRASLPFADLRAAGMPGTCLEQAGERFMVAKMAEKMAEKKRGGRKPSPVPPEARTCHGMARPHLDGPGAWKSLPMGTVAQAERAYQPENRRLPAPPGAPGSRRWCRSSGRLSGKKGRWRSGRPRRGAFGKGAPRESLFLESSWTMRRRKSSIGMPCRNP